MVLHTGIGHFLPLVAYLVGLGVAVVGALGRPEWALYLYTFMLPLQTSRYKLHAFPLGTHYIDIILLGCVVGLWVKEGGIFAKTPINGLLLFYAFFLFLSLIRGAFFLNDWSLSVSYQRLAYWKCYIEMPFVALVAARIIKNEAQVKRLLLFMCLSMVYVGRDFASSNRGHHLAATFVETHRSASALGYAGVNGMAAFEAMITIFLLTIYFVEKRLSVKLGLLFVMAVNTYCLVFSFSRGGWLGFAAGLFALGVLKYRKLLVLLAVVVIGWQVVLPRSVQQRIEMTDQRTITGRKLDTSGEERLELWRNALISFEQRPIIGSGFDTYGFTLHEGLYRDTHNYYMKALVETGIVGLVIFCWLFARMTFLGYTLFWRAEDPFWKAVGLGFTVAMAATLVVNMFGDRWTYQQLDGYLWILLAFVFRGLIVTKEAAATQPETAPAMTPVLAGTMHPATS